MFKQKIQYYFRQNTYFESNYPFQLNFVSLSDDISKNKEKSHYSYIIKRLF